MRVFRSKLPTSLWVIGFMFTKEHIEIHFRKGFRCDHFLFGCFFAKECVAILSCKGSHRLPQATLLRFH